MRMCSGCYVDHEPDEVFGCPVIKAYENAGDRIIPEPNMEMMSVSN